MNLPSEFVSNIVGVFGEEGRKFLDNIPASIEEASQKWNLTNIQVSSELSYNFVAFAKRAWTSGLDATSQPSVQREVVLKMGVPNREMKSEMAALRLFNGEGACQLLDYDEEKYWMLLERLRPGMMLSTLEDDEEATTIAAEVMQKMWRPAPEDSVFIRLSDWFDGLKSLRAMFNGGTGPFDAKLVERAEDSTKQFFLENQKPVLMHGDFHHYNVLSSERGWLVIDPKGVIGPACYEVGPLMLNPWPDLLSRSNARALTQRRIDILHEQLGFERERIREWAVAHAILSSWWSMDDHSDWHYAFHAAEMMVDLPIH